MRTRTSPNPLTLSLAVLGFTLTTMSALGQAPVISSFGQNGQLVCTNLQPGSAASVNLASSVLGPWTNSCEGLDAVTADSNGAIRVIVPVLSVSGPMFYRVRGVPAPSGMALIPAGSFTMGDTFSEGGLGELPLHTNQISTFYMDRTEVTAALWDEVRVWANTNGYDLGTVGSGKAPNCPVTWVNWYDVVKWCNARSQKEGRTQAYYTDAALTQVYETGQMVPFVSWSSGYRLPTEAEWEKAARGGTSGHRFPWSNVETITHSQANYRSLTGYAYDVSPTRGWHPTFNDGVAPFTSPVGCFAANANGYGLYDMAGNVFEWCWDWYGPYSSDSQTDPRGPGSEWEGKGRVLRGGSWNNRADWCRSAVRYSVNPTDTYYSVGFRSVLAPEVLNPPPPPTANAASDVTSSGFTANWSSVSGATGYFLDVSTNSSFSNYLSGYQNLDVGNVTGRSVSGLSAGTTNYYRIRAYNNGGSSGNSGTISVTTDPDTIAPAGMALIPAGPFTMGDTFSEGGTNELPLHTVDVSAFYMDRTEVTKAQWDEVRVWANTNGYDLGAVGLGKATNHPVHTVNWYEVVKWCNARSEREGRVPAYYTNAALTTVYRTGAVDVQNGWVKWSSGYRLPTEAEWEKAARGGTSGHRFPWSNVETITHSQANYYSDSAQAYDLSPTHGNHPTFNDGVMPFTSPAGYFASNANGYGLYDMAGNVCEWCWDWYGSYSSGAQTDPRGAASGSYRVFRGGGWDSWASYCRSALRNYDFYPSGRIDYIGFRSVLAPEVLNPPSPPTANAASGVTGGGFTANWSSVSGATGYFLDVSTNSSFSNYLSGYQNLDVGNVTSRSVSGLSAGTTHYYRIRACNNRGTSGDSDTISVTTNPDTIVPAGMALIPAGPFTMGDSLDGTGAALPLHTNQISAFYMDQYLVTKAQWDEVRVWANTHGYDLGSVGSGKATNHPVHTVNWYDVVKWCNARSEREGRVPAYYTNAALTSVYRIGAVDVQNGWVKWSSGYRLPTEAEWEKAARGGASGQRFPWSGTNNITHSLANYFSATSPIYDTSPTRGYHPSFQAGGQPYTSPVGYFAPNGYGLYDMAGNVWEWTWDWNSGSYSSGAQTDPRGPASGSWRVDRGGGWNYGALYCRAADRHYSGGPSVRHNAGGFRSVLPPGQP